MAATTAKRICGAGSWRKKQGRREREREREREEEGGRGKEGEREYSEPHDLGQMEEKENAKHKTTSPPQPLSASLTKIAVRMD
jgi:hypothetical protein